MRIDALRLRHVRRFGSEGIALEGLAPGLNVWCAPNESGKSTVLDALRAALFFKATSREKTHVRSLRPEGEDGDPYIEIDFTSGRGPVRLLKRFAEGRRGSTTMLSCLREGRELFREAEAEAWIKSFLGGDKPHAGPTGLLWLSQGESLRSVLGTGASTEEQTQTMEEVLTREVAAVAGGEDSRRILAAAEKELATFETPATRKPKGILLDALQDVEALQRQEAELEARVVRGEELRRRLTDRRGDLEVLEDVARSRDDQDERVLLRTDAGRAGQIEAEIGHTNENLERLQADAELTARQYDAFEDDVQALKKLSEAFGMAAERIAGLRRKKSMAEERRDRRRGDVAALREEIQTLRAKLQVLRRHDEDGLRRERLSRLQSARKDVAERVRRLGTIEQDEALEPVDLDALRKAERALEKAIVELRAGSPELLVEQGGPVEIGGRTLTEGEADRLTGDGRIRLGATVLRVTVKGTDALASQKDKAEEHLSHFLLETNCKSPKEAEDRERRRRVAAEEAVRLRAEIARLAPEGTDALNHTIRQLEAAGDDLPDKPSESREQLENALRRAEEAEHLATADIEALTRRLDELRDEIASAEFEQARADARMTALRESLGPEEGWDERRRDLAAGLEALRNTIGGRQHQLIVLREDLARARRAQASLERLDRAEEDARRRREQLVKEIALIEGELRGIYEEGAEGELAALRGDLALAQKRLARLQSRRRALALLVRLIREEEEARREAVLQPVMTKLGPMLEHLFGDASLGFGTDLNPETLVRPGQPADIARLSAGTREQVAVLTRLGFAALMASQEKPVPVILDDALTYADDARARRLFDILHEIAEQTQVIVFTCHEQLFSGLGGHRLEPRSFTERE